MGDRAGNIARAIAALRQRGVRVTQESSLYETEPLEIKEQPWFLNCAVKLSKEKMPKQLLSGVLDLERQMGRRRLEKKGPRIIDIDILLFGDEIVNTPDLTIPHPAMAERRFVLEPLAEIAGQARHPVLKKTVGELLHELPAGQTVRKAKTS